MILFNLVSIKIFKPFYDFLIQHLSFFSYILNHCELDFRALNQSDQNICDQWDFCVCLQNMKVEQRASSVS